MSERGFIATLRPYAFRGKLRLLDRFVPRQGEREAEIFGYRVVLDLADDIQRWIYLGVYEPPETRLLLGRLEPGMTFVDVGANVGYFTLLAASRVGVTGRVLAIEPSPQVFARLERAVQVNGIAQVRPAPIGLSDVAGEMPIYEPPASFRNHSPTMIHWPGTNSTARIVPVKTLDQHLDDAGVDRVDMMKVDVEGHEPAVFRGGARSLRSGRVRAIYCEFNEPSLVAAGSSGDELIRLLTGHGFREVTPKGSLRGYGLDMRLFEYDPTSPHDR